MIRARTPWARHVAHESLWFVSLGLGLAVIVFLSCNGPTKPVGLTQPLSGKITLEHQQDHSWIVLTATSLDTSYTVDTASNGSYTLPILADGTWSVLITYPYYVSVADTIQITNKRATRFTGDRTLTQALQLQARTDRTTYVLGDTVHISIITRNLTTQPVTLVLAAQPGQYYVVRQDNRTIAQFGPFFPAVGTITFTPGQTHTTPVHAPWIPGQYPDQSTASPGTYTVFTLWGPPVECQLGVSEPNYFARPPECSPAAESLLRTAIPTSITLTTPP